jgi:stage V sporulation protein G
MQTPDKPPIPPLVISEVRISLRDAGPLKAFVSMTLNAGCIVRGLKIIQEGRGLFVAMPGRKKPDGTFQDLFHPITSACRAHMEEVILRAYRDARDAQAEPVGARLPRGPDPLAARAALQPPVRDHPCLP